MKAGCMTKEKHPKRIEEMINDEEDLFQSDKDRIKFYREWITIQQINVNKAQLRAFGTGKRDPETGFIDNGCRKGCCRKKYEKELEHLEEIKALLQAERRRQKGRHSDWEEDYVAQMAHKKLDQIRAERGDD